MSWYSIYNKNVSHSEKEGSDIFVLDNKLDVYLWFK